jgi:penicillin amidase
VQTDIYSEPLQFVAAQAAAAYEKRGAHSPELDNAAALLRQWNGQMDKKLAAPLVATLLYQHVRTSVAESAAPDKGAAYDFPFAAAVIEQLLRERPAGWFRDYDQMLLRALVDAVDEGQRMLGRDLKRWQYGAYWRVEIDNPVVHQVPLVGKYFDIGLVPLSGSSTSVKQTTRQLAPSMRMDADLGNWERSLLNLQIGQSGQIFSSHYKDQWEHYYNGVSYPMQFGSVEAASTLQFHPAP